MFGLILAQVGTEIPPAEVVQQAAQVIDAFNNLGVFMAVLGVVALFIIVVLILVWSNRKTGQTAIDVLALTNADKIKELQESREDRRSESLRQQQNHDQFMAALAILAGKQADISTGLTSTEARVTSQVVASEMNVKGRVSATSDATTAAIVKLSEMTNAAFQILLARPPDPTAAERFDKAMAILTAQVVAVAGDLKEMRAYVTANTETGTANTTAISDAATALAAATPAQPVPPSVIVEDISPTAIASIVDTIARKADDLPIASGE